MVHAKTNHRPVKPPVGEFVSQKDSYKNYGTKFYLGDYNGAFQCYFRDIASRDLLNVSRSARVFLMFSAATLFVEPARSS